VTLTFKIELDTVKTQDETACEIFIWSQSVQNDHTQWNTRTHTHTGVTALPGQL